MDTLQSVKGSSWLMLVLVAVLWGVTNPLMKRGSSGIASSERDRSKSKHVLVRLFADLFDLFTRPLYLLAFAVNMLGSVLFILSLSTLDISLSTPLTNSLTFLVTTVTSRLLGEHALNHYSVLGMLSVLLGVTICVSSKV